MIFKNKKIIRKKSDIFSKKFRKKYFQLLSLKIGLNEFPSTSIIINAANEILVDQFLQKKRYLF